MSAVVVTAGAADRLSFTVFLALALHAIIVLGVTFGLEDPKPAPHTMEITLAQYDDGEKPEKADFLAQADPDSDYDAMLERYPGAQVRNFDTLPGVTEADALIAYLQMLGTLVDFSTFTPDASR